MHVTLKTIEKLDALLDEAKEYTECATKAADDQGLRAAYMDLARCHLDGYEKLSKEAERSFERKQQQRPDGSDYRDMCNWHKAKFEERHAQIKRMMDEMR